jgi:hypothetical protein
MNTPVTATLQNLAIDPHQPFQIRESDPAGFSLDRMTPIDHTFHRHPLFQIDQLEALAHRLLPSKQCRFINPGATQRSEFRHHAQSPDGRDLADVFRNITTPGSWIALYNAETDAPYAQLVQEALGSVKDVIEREQTRYFSPQLFIFISAPPSVTPFHIDRENNFWLQIRGRKIMSVWDHHDRIVVPANVVENFIVDRSLSEVRLNDDIERRKQEWEFTAGQGVYFPSTSPHATRTLAEWSATEDAVSVSAGIVFYTETTRQQAYIHSCNRSLRKLGGRPKFPGESRLDPVKAMLGKWVVASKRALRGYQPPTGF